MIEIRVANRAVPLVERAAADAGLILVCLRISRHQTVFEVRAPAPVPGRSGTGGARMGVPGRVVGSRPSGAGRGTGGPAPASDPAVQGSGGPRTMMTEVPAP